MNSRVFILILFGCGFSINASSDKDPVSIADRLRRADALYREIGTGGKLYIAIGENETVAKDYLKQNVGMENASTEYIFARSAALGAGRKEGFELQNPFTRVQLSLRDIFIFRQCVRAQAENAAYALYFEEAREAYGSKLVNLLFNCQDHWSYITAAGITGLTILSVYDYFKRTKSPLRSVQGYLKATALKLIPKNIGANKLFYLCLAAACLGLSLKASMWIEPLLLGEGRAPYDPRVEEYRVWRGNNFDGLPSFLARYVR